MEIIILSQNIWNDNYYWKKRKSLLVELIKEVNPDILGLQEITGKSISNNQLTEIAQQLREYNFNFSIAKKDKVNIYGMGLISKKKNPQNKGLKT